MCELLGMSANVSTDICFSFKGLVKRGGEVGPHKDGWGITFYEGKGCQTFKDPLPCSVSPIAKLVQNYPIKSKSVIAHIRQANRGKIALENTHPFTRELWGKNWTLAHNGQLTHYQSLEMGPYQPVGQTDSEYLFCYLLYQLKKRYPTQPKNWVAVFRYIKRCVDRINSLGVCNLLISDGRYVFAYCSTNLYWLTRKAPFGRAKLLDEDVEIDFLQHTTPSDVVTMIATMPLTANEQWHKIDKNDARLFRHGQIVF